MDFLSIFYIPEMAFLGGSVGAGEWVILFAVVLVVVGPRRLPEVARKFGKTMEMFRRAADEFKEQLMSMDKEVKETVSDVSGGVDIDGVEGEEGPDEAYGDSHNYDEGAYEDSDYPGNEDAVAEWEAESESGALEELENLETPDQNEIPDDSEDVADLPDEVSDAPARGKSGSTEDPV